jgi:hypothetical protein
VLSERPDVSGADLLASLRPVYDFDTDEAQFMPVGEDGWAFRVGGMWISVRRDIAGFDARTYQAARMLHDSGLEFVVPPLRGHDGLVVHWFAHFPVVVYPYVASKPVGNLTSELHRILPALSRLHRVEAFDVPVENFRLPLEPTILDVVGGTEGRPAGGPLAGRIERTLRDVRPLVSEVWQRFGDIAQVLAAAQPEFVMTHGDLSPHNIVVTSDTGDLRIVDWGGCMLAPRERDIAGLERAAVGLLGAKLGDPDVLAFYDLRWWLMEVGEYVAHFLERHDGGPDDEAMWGRLEVTLSTPPGVERPILGTGAGH